MTLVTSIFFTALVVSAESTRDGSSSVSASLRNSSSNASHSVSSTASSTSQDGIGAYIHAGLGGDPSTDGSSSLSLTSSVAESTVSHITVSSISTSSSHTVISTSLSSSAPALYSSTTIVDTSRTSTSSSPSSYTSRITTSLRSSVEQSQDERSSSASHISSLAPSPLADNSSQASSFAYSQLPHNETHSDTGKDSHPSQSTLTESPSSSRVQISSPWHNTTSALAFNILAEHQSAASSASSTIETSSRTQSLRPSAEVEAIAPITRSQSLHHSPAPYSTAHITKHNHTSTINIFANVSNSHMIPHPLSPSIALGTGSIHSCYADLWSWFSSSTSAGISRGIYSVSMWTTEVTFIRTTVSQVTNVSATRLTTLCDGHPRAIGRAAPSPLATSSLNHSQVSIIMNPIPDFPTAPCRIGPSDCSTLWSSYVAMTTQGALAHRVQPPPCHITGTDTRLDQIAARAANPPLIAALSAQLYYWPVKLADPEALHRNVSGNEFCDTMSFDTTSDMDSSTTKHMDFIPATLPGTRTAKGPNTAVVLGTTITSPTVAVVFKSVFALGHSGGTKTLPGVVVTAAPEHLYTARNYAFADVDLRPVQFQDLNWVCEQNDTSAPWTTQFSHGAQCYQDVPAVAYFSASARWPAVSRLMHSNPELVPGLTIANDYHPWAVPPRHAAKDQIQRIWGPLAEWYTLGAWDPPQVLTEQDDVTTPDTAPTTTPASAGKPFSDQLPASTTPPNAPTPTNPSPSASPTVIGGSTITVDPSTTFIGAVPTTDINGKPTLSGGTTSVIPGTTQVTGGTTLNDNGQENNAQSASPQGSHDNQVSQNDQGSQNNQGSNDQGSQNNPQPDQVANNGPSPTTIVNSPAPNVNAPAATVPAVASNTQVTIGSSTLPLTSLSSNIAVVGTQTLTAGGQPGSFDGQQISLGSNGVVVGTGISASTVAITPTSNSLFTIGSETFTRSASGGTEVLFNSQSMVTLSAGGAAITTGGQVFSAASNGLVVSNIAAATPVSTISIGSQILTFSQAPNGNQIFSNAQTTFTLTAGGSAFTSAGQVISAASNGVVVNAAPTGASLITFGSDVLTATPGQNGNEILANAKTTFTLSPGGQAFSSAGKIISATSGGLSVQGAGLQPQTISIGGEVYTILPGQKEIVANAHTTFTLSPGGSAFTTNGQTISAVPGGVIVVSNGVTSTRSFSSATTTSSNAKQSGPSATSPNKADSAHSDVPLGPPSSAAMLDVRIADLMIAFAFSLVFLVI